MMTTHLCKALGSEDISEGGGSQQVGRVAVIFNIVRRHRWVAHLGIYGDQCLCKRPQVKLEVSVCYDKDMCCYPVIDNCVNRHCNAVTRKNLQQKKF